MCFRSVPFSKQLALQIPGLFKMSKYEEHWGGKSSVFFWGGDHFKFNGLHLLATVFAMGFPFFFPGKPPSKSACSKRALAEKRCFTTSKRPEAALMRKGEMPKRSSFVLGESQESLGGRVWPAIG